MTDLPIVVRAPHVPARLCDMILIALCGAHLCHAVCRRMRGSRRGSCRGGVPIKLQGAPEIIIPSGRLRLRVVLRRPAWLPAEWVVRGRNGVASRPAGLLVHSGAHRGLMRGLHRRSEPESKAEI